MLAYNKDKRCHRMERAQSCHEPESATGPSTHALSSLVAMHPGTTMFPQLHPYTAQCVVSWAYLSHKPAGIIGRGS